MLSSGIENKTRRTKTRGWPLNAETRAVQMRMRMTMTMMTLECAQAVDNGGQRGICVLIVKIQALSFAPYRGRPRRETGFMKRKHRGNQRSPSSRGNPSSPRSPQRPNRPLRRGRPRSRMQMRMTKKTSVNVRAAVNGAQKGIFVQIMKIPA